MTHHGRTDIVLYATETMADWEYAYITTQIAQAQAARPGHRRLVIAGDGTESVQSMGGMPVTPTGDLADLHAEDIACLVIPGADTYESGHEKLLATVHRFLDTDVPVAAICGATFALARGGLLDDRRHTSNAPAFLQMSDYAGAQNYLDEPVVTDRGLTTASGTRPVEFSAEVFRRSGLYPGSYCDDWEAVFRDNDEQAFYRLMAAEEALGDA